MDLFLSGKIEQPYFLKRLKRNPALTYRHGEDLSTSLIIYRENDSNFTDFYMFQLRKQNYDTMQQGKMIANSEFSFDSMTYADSLENAKSEILEMCINLEGDAILLREKCRDDDPTLFRDIFYIATLYLDFASNGKEDDVRTELKLADKSN